MEVLCFTFKIEPENVSASYPLFSWDKYFWRTALNFIYLDIFYSLFFNWYLLSWNVLSCLTFDISFTLTFTTRIDSKSSVEELFFPLLYFGLFFKWLPLIMIEWQEKVTTKKSKHEKDSPIYKYSPFESLV